MRLKALSLETALFLSYAEVKFDSVTNFRRRMGNFTVEWKDQDTKINAWVGATLQSFAIPQVVPEVELKGTIDHELALAALVECDRQNISMGALIDRALRMYVTASDEERLRAAGRHFVPQIPVVKTTPAPTRDDLGYE